MRLGLTIILFLSFFTGFSQSISGAWNWKDNDGNHTSEITIEYINNNTLKGNYCSSFFNGEKIDCNVSSEDFLIQISLISKNTYQGTFKSSFSGGIGEIKITYNQVENTFFLEILKKPQSEFYLPDKAIFKR